MAGLLQGPACHSHQSPTEGENSYYSICIEKFMTLMYIKEYSCFVQLMAELSSRLLKCMQHLPFILFVQMTLLCCNDAGKPGNCTGLPKKGLKRCLFTCKEITPHFFLLYI